MLDDVVFFGALRILGNTLTFGFVFGVGVFGGKGFVSILLDIVHWVRRRFESASSKRKG